MKITEVFGTGVYVIEDGNGTIIEGIYRGWTLDEVEAVLLKK